MLSVADAISNAQHLMLIGPLNSVGHKNLNFKNPRWQMAIILKIAFLCIHNDKYIYR